MERPSFIATLKQAHRFTIQNFWTFLPLALKTSLLILGVAVVSIGIMMLCDLINFSKPLTGQVLSLITPLNIILGIVLVFLLLSLFFLAFNPLVVSLYRRALLNEEIDRKYLKRLLATRELNLFVVQLKMIGVSVALLLIGCAFGGLLYGLAVFMESEVINVITLGIGSIAGLVWIGISFFLWARLAFVIPNVVLDRGIKLKTSIIQTQKYTFFLLGILVLVNCALNFLKGFFQGFFQTVVEKLLEGSTGAIGGNILSIIIGLIFSYYILIFVAAAIAYIYKAVVFKGEAEEQQVIAPL